MIRLVSLQGCKAVRLKFVMSTILIVLAFQVSESHNRQKQAPVSLNRQKLLHI
jgi:hypothetical protein